MGTTAEKLQAIKSSKENIRLAINEKGVTLDTSAPLSSYADSIKQISVSEDYDPANAKQYREKNRNKAWPTMLLPSEMSDSSDHIFFLVDLSVPRRFFSINFVGADTNNIVITSKYYKDTTLIKSVVEPELTSTIYENYYTADSGENYLIVEVEAARGNISKLAVGLTGNYGYYGVDSGILEISGNCSSIAIQMNGNANLLRTLRMEYFSFYGLNQYGENNLYLGSTSSDTSGSLKSVPELKFVNTVLYLDWMFRFCSELVSIDDTAFSGCTISGLGDTFRDCQNLINCGYINTFVEYPSIGYAFYNCRSLPYMPISKLPHNITTDSNSNNIYTGCTSISDISEAYSDPENDGFTKMNSSYIFNSMHITELPETFIEGPNQSVSEWFRYCPIVTYRGVLNGTKVIANNNAFASCQQFRMTNITRSLDIRNSQSNRYNLYTRDELLWIFNNGLEPVTTSQTLTVGAAALALLSDSDKAIATDKGWTLT